MLLRFNIFRLQKCLPNFPYSLPLLIIFPRLQYQCATVVCYGIIC